MNSLYFMIVYLFFSIPTIALGFASTYLGLYTALIFFAGIIAAFILMEMVWLAAGKDGPIPDDLMTDIR